MSRKLARETAFKILFQIDVGKSEPNEALEYMLIESYLNKEDIKFVRKIIKGVIETLPRLNNIIEDYLIKWEVKRLANIDRALLRLALYEIIYLNDIPPAVSINEAIEMAKIYQGEKSAAFINGVLDAVLKDMEKK